MGKIPESNLALVKRLYYGDELSMKEIGGRLGVSIDAVVYFMRRHKLQRRDFFEMNRLRFEKKSPSFKLNKSNSREFKELKAIGAMLYWGEGYKSGKASCVDFANSDPEMISMFLRFLRKVYKLDQRKLRVLLYCYADQNVKLLKKFWSDLTGIPVSQLTKPYVRSDFRKDGRKMEHGLIHIRYIDKKLLLELKNLIQFYKDKYASVG